MLPAQHRLRGDSTIKRVVQRGRSAFSHILSVRVVPNEGPHTRFTFVVSQKVSKRAVERNTLRRRLSEIVRTKMDIIRKGFDVLMSTRPGATKLSFEELKKEVDDVLTKARLTSPTQAHAPRENR